MGIVLPQLAPASEDRVSGAQVIDGCLRFDKNKNQYLTRTPGSAGNRKKSTISYWIKRTIPVANFNPTTASVFGVEGGSSWFDLSYYTVDEIQFILTAGANSTGMRSQASYRDFSNWYHVCAVLDTDRTNDDGANSRMRVWINGKEVVQKATTSGQPAAGTITFLNDSGRAHHIGRDGRTSSIRYGDNYLAQFYIVDGLVLGPDHFGYYDPLTNVWRPKKFTADGTTINDGRSWSGTSSVSNNNGNANGAGSLAAVFNGTMTANGSNAYGFTTGSMDFTWTPNTPIPFGSQVRVWTGFSGGTVYLNGTEEIVTTNNNAWTTLTNGRSGKITSIRFVGGSGGGWWAGVEVDGVVLVDSATQNLDFGTNGCYLPLDGNSPIGEDQSGKGNNWTPVNFGGSVDITKATGAFPILNTGNGGTVARPGVLGSEVSRNYTILGTSGGGLYRFDGITETNPPLSFVRGATYIFDYSATSGSHPLAFSTTDPDSSTTSYTDGVNTSTSNVTKITVPHDAPDTLYYYCTSHSNMNNAITVTTDETKADPYAWKNVLALPLVGSSADVSDQINVGSTAKTANNNNGSATASSAASNFYNGSFYFDGNDTLRYDNLSHIGTGDFTVECWYYKIGHNSYERVVSTSTGTQTDMNLGFVLGRDASGETSFSCGGNSVTGPTISLNTWHHLAGVRDNGVLEFFVDGVSQGTVANTTNLTNTDQIYVSGNYNGGSEFLNGYIQDVRIYDGVVKYTSNFIPASTNPDILPDTPSGVATKSKLKKITDGAVSFDGPKDGAVAGTEYLTIPSSNSSDFNFGTGDFTWEAYVYSADWTGGSSNDDQFVIAHAPSAGGDISGLFVDGGQSYYYSNKASSRNVITGPVLADKRWYHIAASRESGTLRLFVDGVSVGSASYTDTYADAIFTLGRNEDNNKNQFRGFISNFRVIKGTALYTSNFTPPTEPLTTTSQGATASQVKLLTCQNLTTDLPTIAQSDGGLPIYNTDATGTSITSGTRTDSNSANIDIALPLNGSNGGTTFTDVSDVIRGSGSAGTVTRSGTVTSTAQSLYYGSSAFFDGSNDYLEIPFPAISSTETWTIEWYQYQTANMPNPCTLCGNSGSSFFTFGTADGNKIGFNWRNGAWSNGNRFFSPSNELTVPGGLINKWVHIVYQRNSDYTISVFANGELLQKSTNTYQASLGSGSDTGATLRIGNNNSSYWFSGYLQDIRIYSGVAKYGSSSFTPPTAPILPSTVSPGIVNVRGNSAPNNFNPFTTDINTVRGQESGYATLNPLTSIVSLSDGNLKQAQTSGTWNVAVSSIPMSTGKWYCEVTLVGGNTLQIGIIKLDDGPNWAANFPLVDFPYGWGMIVDGSTAKLRADYITQLNGRTDAVYNSIAPVTGDTIGMAYDADTQALTFYVNGVSYGDTTSYWEYPPTPGEYVFGNSVVSNTDALWNFGQKPFKFSPPDGYQPLSASTARPDTVITHPNKYVSVMTYSGTNNSGNVDVTSTDTDFTPDFVWVKTRTGGNEHNAAYDSVRGANKRILPSSSNQEVTTSANDLNAFIPGGFTMNGQNGHIYNNGYTHVAWMWKAGGGKVGGGGFFKDDIEYASAAAAGLTAGTITPDAASVGTKQGFSIIKYSLSGSSAQTIPHGLDGSLGLLITKATSTGNGWAVWHSGIGDTQGLVISGTDAANSVTWWDQSNMTNNVFAHKAGTTSQSAAPVIAYCWHDVPGLQKFGKYTGNSSSSGPFIECGFRPALILLKKIVSTDANSGWHWYDNKRNTYNPANNFLLASANYYENRAQNNTADVSTYTVDFLSNGFRLSHGSNNLNSSGATYIYAAWAEAPSFNLYGAQSNAR